MRDIYKRFQRSERSAIMIIFAISIAPLMWLVGLSVDYTFYANARAQEFLAAEAAATHAVRTALATFYTEVGNGTSTLTATNDAYTDGGEAGTVWFVAQLGRLPRGSVASTDTTPVAGQAKVVVQQPASNGGFQAVVTYTGTYPPLFNGLLGRTTAWKYPGNSQAAATFDYAEVVLLIDDSGSMEMGTGTADIQTLQNNSICELGGSPPAAGQAAAGGAIYDNTYTTNLGGTALGIEGHDSSSSGQYSQLTSADLADLTANNVGVTLANVSGYNTSQSKCNTTAEPPDGSYQSGSPAYVSNSTTPLVPCALACHSTTSTSTESFTISHASTSYALPMDNYGEARRLRLQELAGTFKGYNPYTSTTCNANCTFSSSLSSSTAALSLRLDVVFNSTETMLTDMTNDEQFTGQFTAGVFAFHYGSTSAPAALAYSGTGSDPEGTDLTDALADVKRYDWIQTPTETALPPIEDGTRDTDLPTAMSDLLAGTIYSSPTAGSTSSIGALPSNGNGGVNSPDKFLFIITDGFQDVAVPYGNSVGGMTGYNAENNIGGTSGTTYEDSNSDPAVCYPYKAKGWTVYVLQIEYFPLASVNYYTAPLGYVTNYTANDYPSQFTKSTENNTTGQNLSTNKITSADSSPPGNSTLSPIEVEMKSCASNSSDYFQANDASSISNAVNQMLTSALASTIRITN